MTERLYYTDSFLAAFDARLVEVREQAGRHAIVLDRSAFYPASGGQVCDTGWLALGAGAKLRVDEVAEDDSGEVLHILGAAEAAITPGATVHGTVDLARRRDHMQQHSGQHVLSAAFIRLFNFPTVSFHMGDECCTIDLDAKSLTDAQVREAEALANSVVMENRPVEIRFSTLEEARGMGVRKLPPDINDRLRLIDIRDFDLNACGGTHVASTGQIGPILLRKTEKVKQGIRLEFVCGERALRTARRDFETLTEAAAAFSTHIWEVPQQVRKSLDEAKAAQKERKRLFEELAELQAARLLVEAQANVIAMVFPDRDLASLKLLAQKVVDADAGRQLIALFGGSGGALVFAQTAGGKHDMGALMKEAMAALGGRGGGNQNMAQGGAPVEADLEAFIQQLAARLRSTT